MRTPTRVEGALTDSEDDEEEMDDIDEVPINPLPHNREADPEDQQTKVTRQLEFARQLQ